MKFNKANKRKVSKQTATNNRLICLGLVTEKLADKLVEYCGKMFGDVGDFFYNADHDSFGDGNFTIDTKTIGGIQ